MSPFNILKTNGVIILALNIIFLITKSHELIVAATILLVVALFINRLAAIIAKVWMKFAQFIGELNSKILLTISFYLFLTPMALIYQLTNKGTFRKKPTGSFYKIREYSFKPEDFEKMW